MPILPIVAKFKKAFSFNNIPTSRGIGIECEIPIVTITGEAVPLFVVQNMFTYLGTIGFNIEQDDFSGLMTEAHRNNLDSAKDFPFYKDIITTDTGYSTLEIVLAPQNNLHTIQLHLTKLLSILTTYFSRKNCLMLGYGIQPLTFPSNNLLMPKERYLFFEKFSSNNVIPRYRGTDAAFLNITASNQCHIEIGLKETIPATNVLNALSGLQIAFHANSPIWQGKVDPAYKANREMLWDVCFADRLNQIGIPPRFKHIENYVDYLLQFKPLLVKRNGHYLQIINKDTFTDFFLNQSPTVGRTINGEKRIIEPQTDDFQYLIPFSWFNARLVPKYGTIESRMCCQQPQHETLTSTALTLGIIENLEPVIKLSQAYPISFWQTMRKKAAQDTFNAKINGISILPLLHQVLAIARTGLQKRNLQEEIFLEPLYQRLQTQKAPADLAIETFNKQGLKGLLKYISFKSTANKSGIESFPITTTSN